MIAGILISGFYENGQIVLDELPKINKKVQVFISFTEPLEIKSVRKKRQFGISRRSVIMGDDFNESSEDSKDCL